jgi:hypothetical protein
MTLCTQQSEEDIALRRWRRERATMAARTGARSQEGTR